MSIVRGPVGQVQLQVVGKLGQSFLLQTSSDFKSWTNFATDQLSGSTFELTDPAPSNMPRRFYRVQ